MRFYFIALNKIRYISIRIESCESEDRSMTIKTLFLRYKNFSPLRVSIETLLIGWRTEYEFEYV